MMTGMNGVDNDNDYEVCYEYERISTFGPKMTCVAKRTSYGHGARPTCFSLKPTWYLVLVTVLLIASVGHGIFFPNKFPSVTPLNCRRSHP